MSQVENFFREYFRKGQGDDLRDLEAMFLFAQAYANRELEAAAQHFVGHTWSGHEVSDYLRGCQR